MASEPDRQETAPETVPLEVHIVALRAELERTQSALRLASGILAAVALMLAWQVLKGGGE